AGTHPETAEHPAVERPQLHVLGAASLDRLRGVHAAPVRHLEGGRSAAVDLGEEHLPVPADGVDVIDVTADELLEQEVRAAIASRLQLARELRGGMNLHDPAGRGLAPG